MTALRLVGTFFLVVCGWCAGDAVCIRTQEHLEALRQTIALLEEIEQEITFRRADLNMLSKKLQRFRSFLQQQEKAAQSRLVLAPKLGILLGLTAAILLF